MTESFKKYVNSQIEKFCDKAPDGYFEYEIYADYRDYLTDKQIRELLEEKNPMDAFYEKIIDAYEIRFMESIDDIIGRIICHIEYDGFDFDKAQVESYIQDMIFAKYPYNHFLKQKVCVDIFVDTGDGNYDYTLNCLPPCYYSYYDGSFSDKASVVWLAKNQGVKKSELKKALTSANKEDLSTFLKSVRAEVANASSHMNILTFLVEMTLEELLKLNELINLQDVNGRKYDATERPYCGYIVIDKNTTTGLFDSWSGAGSLLEIELEKDVKLPIRFIASAYPDGCEDYSVKSVYGTNSSIWENGKVKLIHAPVKVAKNTA